jgi:hypothetical protein
MDDFDPSGNLSINYLLVSGIDVRWLTGEVGGFLLIDFVGVGDFG